MRISTFFYTIQQGIVNIWRKKTSSLASVATMTACIFLFGLFYMIVVNFQSMVKDAESQVAVTVLFEPGISDQRIDTFSSISMCHQTLSGEFTDRSPLPLLFLIICGENFQKRLF